MATATATERKTARQKPGGAGPKVNGKEAVAGGEQTRFFERLARYSDADWEGGLSLRIYRTLPRINKPGKHYIEKLNCTIADEQTLLERHGSGQYFLLLNNKSKTVDQATVSVYNPDFPPRVELDQVVEDPANGPYLALLKKKPDGSGKAETASDAAAEAVKQMGSITRAAQARGTDETLADLYLKTAEARDALVTKLSDAQGKPDAAATEQLSLVTQVLDLVERLQQKREGDAPRPANGGDPITMLDKVLSVAERINKQQAPPAATDPLSSLDKALEVFDKLRSLTTPEESPTPVPNAEASTWEKVGALVVRLLEPAMPAIGQAVAQKLTGAPGGTPPTAPALPGPAATSSESPSSPSAPQETSTAAPAAASAGTTDSADPAAAQLSQLMNVLNIYGPQIVEAIAVGEEGAGADFADSVCKLGGELTYRHLANWGKDAWMSAIQSHAIWLQLAHIPERVDRFVTEFVSFGLPQPADEPEPPPKEKHRGRRKPESAGLVAA